MPEATEPGGSGGRVGSTPCRSFLPILSLTLPKDPRTPGASFPGVCRPWISPAWPRGPAGASQIQKHTQESLVFPSPWEACLGALACEAVRCQGRVVGKAPQAGPDQPSPSGSGVGAAQGGAQVPSGCESRGSCLQGESRAEKPDSRRRTWGKALRTGAREYAEPLNDNLVCTY